MARTKFTIMVLGMFLLAACTPSPQTIQTAIAQTQAAIPTQAIIPSSTPRPDITSVILANGFIPADLQSYTNGKQYLFKDNQQAIILTAVVYDNGMLSIAMWRISEEDHVKIRSVLLASYGPEVANWVAVGIVGMDFSQPFKQNGTVDGYNIDILISGQGIKSLNIIIMPVSQ
jgi:hypothetical protein